MVCAPATVTSRLKFRCGNSGTASRGIATSALSGLTRPPTTDSDERQQSAPQRSAPIRTPIKIPGMKFRASTPKEHPASPTESPTVGCGREWGFGHCVTGAIFTRFATVKGFTVRCKRVMCHHDSRHSSRHRGQPTGMVDMPSDRSNHRRVRAGRRDTTAQHEMRRPRRPRRAIRGNAGRRPPKGIMNVDSGVAVITWHLDGLTDLNTVDITVAGTAPLEPHDIRTQMRWPRDPRLRST